MVGEASRAIENVSGSLEFKTHAIKKCLLKMHFFFGPSLGPSGLCLGFASTGLWASARASEKHFQRAFFYGWHFDSRDTEHIFCVRKSFGRG